MSVQYLSRRLTSVIGVGICNGILAPKGQQRTQAGDSPGIVGSLAVAQQGVVGVALAGRQWYVVAVGRESSHGSVGHAMALSGWRQRNACTVVLLGQKRGNRCAAVLAGQWRGLSSGKG
jgi:hypothetical protein